MARAHAKQELELKTREGREGRRGREDDGTSEEKQAAEEEDGPELRVEVMGETLPKLSHQEEIKVRQIICTIVYYHCQHFSVHVHMQMIHLAGHQFDMLDSVLVRVEELLDDRT
jgi:hypothetical protein